jgi:malonate transporter
MAAARARILPLDAIPGLNTFVLYFALPCMLLRFGAGTPIGAVARWQRGTGLGRARWWWWRAWCLHPQRAHRLERRAFGALVAAFPNTGFMGVPLLVALLGAQAAGPMIITIAFDLVVTSSLCIALSRLDGAGSGAGHHGALAGGAQGAARHAGQSDAVVDPAGRAAVGRAGACRARGAHRGHAGRCGLAGGAVHHRRGAGALGIARARHGASAAVAAAMGTKSAVPRKAPLADVLPVAGVKLLVHPLLVWALGQGAIALGLPLSSSALVVIVLVAALPSASNVSMLAERFGADNGRIARIILWTTVATFFSFPLAVGVLR